MVLISSCHSITYLFITKILAPLQGLGLLCVLFLDFQIVLIIGTDTTGSSLRLDMVELDWSRVVPRTQGAYSAVVTES